MYVHTPQSVPTSCTAHRLVHTPHSVPTSCTVHRLVHTPHSVPAQCAVHRLVHTPQSVPTSCTVQRLVHTPHSVPTSCVVHRLVCMYVHTYVRMHSSLCPYRPTWSPYLIWGAFCISSLKEPGPLQTLNTIAEDVYTYVCTYIRRKGDSPGLLHTFVCTKGVNITHRRPRLGATVWKYARTYVPVFLMQVRMHVGCTVLYAPSVSYC